MSSKAPPVFIIGRLREEYLMTHEDKALLPYIGGPAAYAACAARLWQTDVKLVSRLWEPVPRDWDRPFRATGVGTERVQTIPEADRDPVFLHQTREGDILDHHPAAHYLRAGIKLPKALISYTSSRIGENTTDRFTPHTIQPVDLGTGLLQDAGLYMCPGHYLTHATLPLRARELEARYIAVSPSPSYMNPAFHDEVAAMIQGLDAVLLDEASCRRFFQREAIDLPIMMETLGSFGAHFIIITCQDGQKRLWNHAQGSHWAIPAYPGHTVTSIGTQEAFGGGFIAGMLRTDDPVEACLYGNVTESLAREGYGPWYAADAHPDLAALRLAALRETAARSRL